MVLNAELYLPNIFKINILKPKIRVHLLSKATVVYKILPTTL